MQVGPTVHFEMFPPFLDTVIENFKNIKLFHALKCWWLSVRCQKPLRGGEVGQLKGHSVRISATNPISSL